MRNIEPQSAAELPPQVTRTALAPDVLLRRPACAEALTKAGYPVRTATLATYATRGGGPPYRKFGRMVLYRWDETLAWAAGRLSKPIHSTSDVQE
jgi:hypothetical protein